MPAINTSETIAVIGLGYVGLPLATALGRIYQHVVGFDIHQARVAALTGTPDRAGHDWTHEVDDADLRTTQVTYTSNADDLKNCSFFLIAVPTPVDQFHRPDLSPLESACRIVGPALSRNAIVVFESTVYPGVTEDVCGPWLEQYSGLKAGVDFFLGYSPERIDPGNKVHTLKNIAKIIGANDDATRNRMDAVYGSVIDTMHHAPTIKVAEAAKVIENAQRDVNIAFMNEVAMVMNTMNIRTADVIAAMNTKFNAMRFSPGLVGGHCIGVDPYYLTSQAEQLGDHLQIILAGRRINDGMGAFIAKQTVQEMIRAGQVVKGAKVGLLGITFKENVPDLRNSRVVDIIQVLEGFGIECIVHDAIADPAHVLHEYKLDLADDSAMKNLDGVILTVAHTQYCNNPDYIQSMLKPNGVMIDVKSRYQPDDFPAHRYWSL